MTRPGTKSRFAGPLANTQPTRPIYIIVCVYVCVYLHASVSECVNWSTNFSGLPFNVKMAPSRFNCMNFVLSSQRGQCLLLPVPGYAAGIRLAQVYLREALTYFGSNI